MNFVILEESLGVPLVKDLRKLVELYTSSDDYNLITRKVFRLANKVKDIVVNEYGLRGRNDRFGDVFNINNSSINSFEKFLFRRGYNKQLKNNFWFEENVSFKIKNYYDKISKDFIDYAYNNKTTDNPVDLYVKHITLLSLLLSTLYNFLSCKNKGRRKYSNRLFLKI